MNKKHPYIQIFILALLMFQNLNSFSQREFGVCDSTFYTLNADTTIIVGKRHIWFESNGSITFCTYFPTENSNFFIRDFDIIQDNFWYVLVGSKTISNETFLYKSSNRGLTWTQDSSFYSVSKYDQSNEALMFYNSINNVQKINDSSIVLFMGYYNSGLIYSTNLGASWKYWFRTSISHYQGLLECEENYFLWSYSGDGFQPSMFSFPKSALFSPDTGTIVGAWQYGGLYNPGCYMGGGFSPPVVGCYYAPLEIATERCNQYNYFINLSYNLCQNVGLTTELYNDNAPLLFPNPVKTELIIEFKNPAKIDLVEIKDVFGKLIQSSFYHEKVNRIQLEVENKPQGFYFITIRQSNSQRTLKFLKINN